MVDAELAAAGLGEGGGEGEGDGDEEGEEGEEGVQPPMGLSPLPSPVKGGAGEGAGTGRPTGPPLRLPPTMAGYCTQLMGNGNPIVRQQEIFTAGERQGLHSNRFACAPTL